MAIWKYYVRPVAADLYAVCRHDHLAATAIQHVGTPYGGRLYRWHPTRAGAEAEAKALNGL
jgi:hypothetical protein